jgi:thymidylate synthase
MVKTGEPIVLKCFDIPTAYYELNYAIWTRGVEWSVEAPYNQMSKALLNVVLHIEHPEIRPLRHPEAPVTEEYISLYAYTKLMTGEKEAGETYTYGERLKRVKFMNVEIEYDQFQKALQKLKSSPSTRRAVLVISRPWDIESMEPPCLREIQIWLEPPNFNVMHSSVFIRSWDAHRAANANLGALQLMQEELAGQLKAKTGSMTVFAANAHIYEDSYPIVEKWFKRRVEAKRFHVEE